jgi:hypothetical protein
MTSILKYNLIEVAEISVSGFTYIIPDKTIELINYLTYQIGSTSIITSNLFEKKESTNNSNTNTDIKKRKFNKMDTNGEWETIRTFQPTKMEKKIGFDADIDIIRLYFNKLTDKTFLDMRKKIIEQIGKMCLDFTNEEDKIVTAEVIYELSSSNKFYSRIFTELYSELAVKYDWIKMAFNAHYANVMSLYNNIEYFDSDKDYNKFCDMNKTNEKRKSTTLFLVNLANNGFIEKIGVFNILKQLLQMILIMITQPDKKNEVDELTENIAILFSKEIIDGFVVNEEHCIDGNNVNAVITNLAKCKVKDYPSLSNKSIFKCMDLVEI